MGLGLGLEFGVGVLNIQGWDLGLQLGFGFERGFHAARTKHPQRIPGNGIGEGNPKGRRGWDVGIELREGLG